MQKNTIIMEENVLEGMLQYIEDEIISGIINPKTGIGIIENLINENGVNDIRLISLVSFYSDKFYCYC